MTPDRILRRSKVVVLQTAVALCIGVWGGAPSQAQTSVNPIDREQFRRTVDPSNPGPFGTLIMKKSGATQTAQVKIQNLGGESWGVFLSDAPTFNTNALFRFVAQLDRTDEKHGIWLRKFSHTGGAPVEFEVEDLDFLAGKQIDIAQPGPTNIVGGVTNIVGTVTNIVGGVTNFTVNVVLWAPVNTLTTDPSAENYTAKSTLHIPSEPLIPSPKAKGTVVTKFSRTTGQSVLNLHATGLLRGQVYTVYIEDGVETFMFVAAGSLVLDKEGTGGKFVRDTKLGDPLPQQARKVGDLTGRTIVIVDAFDDIYLIGTIP